MSWNNPNANPSVQRFLLTMLCIGALALVFQYAWVAEDAYITFRVVDNFVHGFGLRWNIDERVQVYTHPLWMLLHIPLAYIFSNIYLITIGLSAVCSLVATALIAFAVKADGITRWMLVVVPLSLSETFRSFAISGLENSLSFLLLAWFIYTWCKHGVQRYALLFFIAALLLITRFDNLFIIAPLLAYVSLKTFRNWKILKIIIAWSPLWAWCGFSLVYYGFIFPNTKYAKLNTGIALGDYIQQGGYYLFNYLSFDPIGAALVVFLLLFTLKKTLPVVRKQKLLTPLKLLCLLLGHGAWLNIAYILYVGGDFMSGRFLANIFFVSIFSMFALCHAGSERDKTLFLVTMLIISFFHEQVVKPNMADPTNLYEDFNHGIINEQAFYATQNGMFRDTEHIVRTEPVYLWVIEAKKLREETHGKTVAGMYGLCNIGMFGYYAGSNVIIIDCLALTDPYLARLPAIKRERMHIGHFIRKVPEAYLAERQGKPHEEPLAPFYKPLRLITSAPLWDKNRWQAIWDFQTGKLP